MSWLAVNRLIWIVFGLVWFVGALLSKRTVQRESLAMRALYGVPLLVALILIFSHYGSAEVPVLEFPVVPHEAPYQVLGLVFTALGVSFAIWARVELGRLWSGAITLKEGHRLVQTGPYAFARHPIYTGCLLALFGTTLVMDTLRATIGFVIAVFALLRKISSEEALMAKSFDAEHDAYKRRVKKLIPFVW